MPIPYELIPRGPKELFETSTPVPTLDDFNGMVQTAFAGFAHDVSCTYDDRVATLSRPRFTVFVGLVEYEVEFGKFGIILTERGENGEFLNQWFMIETVFDAIVDMVTYYTRSIARMRLTQLSNMEVNHESTNPQ